MANIASMLKEEIIRLAKKEIRIETEGLKKASAQYRSEIAALKRQVVQLQKQVTCLEKSIAKNTEPKVEAASETTSKSRFTTQGFITLRKKLGLSVAESGRLLGVSAQTIYSWEAGNSSPRAQQLVNIVVLRGMGKKEVRALLEDHVQ